MRDFWLSCGHHLLDRDAGGGLKVTDDFLKAYLARPELIPPPEACVVERTLHAALMADPRRPMSAEDIAAITDADARENWQLMIGYRDHLVRHPTLEAAYLALVRQGVGRTPPLFLNQAVQLILRNALDDCEDATVLRAAEMFFRPQLLTVHEGSLISADEETIAGSSDVHISPLVSMMGLPASGEIEVIAEANADSYFERSDRFDMALDLTAGRAGHAALARVIAHWVGHLLAVEVAVEPLTELREASFTWYVGLDAEATAIGNALWSGEQLDDATGARVIGLYRLNYCDPATAAAALQGEPVYLLLAMTSDRRLRMKPQNLLVGLPAIHLEAVS
jgi:hypothetical protein